MSDFEYEKKLENENVSSRKKRKKNMATSLPHCLPKVGVSYFVIELRSNFRKRNERSLNFLYFSFRSVPKRRSSAYSFIICGRKRVRMNINESD